MTALSCEDSKLFKTKAFKKFLDEGITPSENYIQYLYELRLRYVEAVTMEIYHQLIWFLDHYPSVKSVSPAWTPGTEQCELFFVRFRLNLVTEEKSPNEPPQLQEACCGFEEYPESIAKTGEERFDALIEAGEHISQELWNEFGGFKLTRNPIYTSIEEVQKDMDEDLSDFLIEFSKWKLEQNLSKPQKIKTSPRL